MWQACRDSRSCTACTQTSCLALQDLEGGREQFAAICKELKLAGRFMLMRDPGAGNNPDLEERVVEEGACRDQTSPPGVLHQLRCRQTSANMISCRAAETRCNGHA